MKFDLNQVIKNYRNEPMKNTFDEREKDKDLILKDVLCMALLMPIEADQKMKWRQKLELETLAKEIYEGKDDIESQDIALLKERVGAIFNPSLVGPVCRILEQKENKK